jgi:hypothetical protein
MGLLDDAIREHLELKRLRGADPGEVAREQREALTESLAGEGPATRQSSAPLEEEGWVESLAEEQPREPDPLAQEPWTHTEDVIQETAELDMRAVLGDEPENPARDRSVNRPITGGRGVGEDEDMEESSSAWELPDEDSTGRQLDETHSGRGAVDADK